MYEKIATPSSNKKEPMALSPLLFGVKSPNPTVDIVVKAK
jgi:hypothetical protein